MSDKSKTTIVIAHRLSTVKMSDIVLMLENGQIVEQGTHDELFNMKGKYYQLIKKQISENENNNLN